MKQACPIAAVSLFFGTVCGALCGQNQAAHVLPKEMLRVPGGVVELGTDAGGLVESLARVNTSTEMQVRNLHRMLSELGRVRVEVAPFYMSKHLVTNEQYQIFVEKTGHRFPFDWWRLGREDDYDQRLAEINETVKAEENKDLVYWQQNWQNLPHQIPTDKDDRRKPKMDQYPVVYVSWKDAIALAAWAGMRLPTEAEWTLACTGGQDREFLWGDSYDDLKIQRGSRYNKPWPVGHWGEHARGPFGHEDLVLHVFEWTNDLGFFAFDSDKFFDERKKLLREKLLRDKNNRHVESARRAVPEWRGDTVVCKGGWYGSNVKDELRIATRAPQESFQTRSGIGFRLAKSEPPALDVASSMIKLDYDYSYFGGERKPNLKDQVGIERYELSSDGRLIHGYHALSLVPVSFMTDDKKLNTKDRLLDASRERPIVIGTLVITDKLSYPELDRGIYTLAYRDGRMPEELTKALADGRKALKAFEKAKERAKEGDQPELDVGTWAKVLKTYGITDEECLAGDVDFVRVNPGALKIPARQNLLLVRDREGRYIGSFPAPAPMGVDGKYKDTGAQVAVAPGEVAGTENITFDFGVPPTSRDAAKGKKAYTFRLRVTLPPESAGGNRWRLPGTSISAAATGGGSHDVQEASSNGGPIKRASGR